MRWCQQLYSNSHGQESASCSQTRRCRQQASKGQPLRYDVITIALHSTCQLFYIIHSMRSPRGLLRLLARNAAHGD